MCALDTRRSRFPVVELLLALALIAGLVVFWFWTTQEKQSRWRPLLQVPPVAACRVPARAARDTGYSATYRSLLTAVVPDAAGVVKRVPPEATCPPAQLRLRRSRVMKLLRQQLAAAGARPILMKLLSDQQPLEVSAALIDGLGHGIILRKFLSGSLHSEGFSVVTEDDGIYMSPTSFLRYDKLSPMPSPRWTSAFW